MSRCRRRHTLQRKSSFERLEGRFLFAGDWSVGFDAGAITVDRSHGQPDRMSAPAAEARVWNDLVELRTRYGVTGAGQTVAIIDSGIAHDHLALGAGFGSPHRIVGGWDFAENDSDPYDDPPAGFHGTHVAGIVASSDVQHPGIAPEADLVALRVFDDQGRGQLDWIEQALQWVHDHRDQFDHPITTVNLSLGVAWNGTHVPDWSSLEDELAQLEQDGMFITVAAGNAFQQLGEPGLSYPAASQYVVPVASVDREGRLSDFSQRDARVLAAPGELVMSAVPDFLFGGDGLPNDFGEATGTSMAAPYVAGAGVLVREAMESAGYEQITQDVIYEHLKATADPVFDGVTGLTYHRINLFAALESLMVADAAATGTDGTEETPVAVQPEAIDFGQVVFDQKTIHVYGTDDADELRLDLTKGELIVNGVRYADWSFPVTELIVDAGTGTDRLVVMAGDGRERIFVRQDGVELQSDSFHLTAKGVEHYELDARGGDDVARVYDSTGDDTLEFHDGRLEFQNDDRTVRITNVPVIYAYAVNGGHDTAQFYDSPGNDLFVADNCSASMVGPRFNNTAYGFEHVVANGTRRGYDVARLYGSAATDTLRGNGEQVVYGGNQYVTIASQFDRVYVHASRGGDDRNELESGWGDVVVLVGDFRTPATAPVATTEVLISESGSRSSLPSATADRTRAPQTQRQDSSVIAEDVNSHLWSHAEAVLRAARWRRYEGPYRRPVDESLSDIWSQLARKPIEDYRCAVDRVFARLGA